MEKMYYNTTRECLMSIKSAITSLESKNSGVITLKPKKQVGSITAAEIDALVTADICMNATVIHVY